MQMPPNISGIRGLAPSQPETAAASMPNAGLPPMTPDQQPNVEPAEQEAYDRIVAAASAMILSPKMKGSVDQAISGPNRARGVASVAAATVLRVATQMAKTKAGAGMTEDAVFHAFNEVLGQTMALAEADGQPFSEKEQADAAVLGFDQLRVGMQQAGMIDKAEAMRGVEEIRANPGAVDAMMGGAR